MTDEANKLLDAITERLAVVEAKVEALRTAAYQRLTLDERQRPAKARERVRVVRRMA